MHIYHYTLVFATVFLIIAAILGNYRREDFANDEQAKLWSEAIERGVDAAAQEMKNFGENVYASRDWIAENFYGALISYLNLAGESVRASTLSLYIPILLITEDDGFFVCSTDYYEQDDGSVALYRNWTEKIPFCYEDDCYAYLYGKGDKITRIAIADSVISDGTDYIMETDFADGRIDSRVKNSRDVFVSKRLTEVLGYYCNRHNLVAEQVGIEYQFYLPDSAEGEIKNIQGTGFYAIFQGYPVRYSDGMVRNMYKFAGTRVDDCERFYVNLAGNGLSSERYYHRSGCAYLTDDANSYVSRKECAEQGAFACTECCGY